MSALPDARLAELAADGAETALRAIFGRHGDEVFRFCCALAGRGGGEELFREAVAGGIQALRAGDLDETLRTLLLRCAHEARGCVEATRLALDEGGVPGVLERLEGLSQTPRGALVLREVSGLGYSAIGRVLGIPPATARRTVADARRVMTAARGRGDDGGEVREGDVSEDEVGEDELGEELDRRLPHLSEVLLSMALREGLARANARPNRAGSRAARRRMRRGLVATAVGAFLLVATVLGFTADRLSRPAKLSPPPALVPLAQLGAPGPLGGAELPSESGRHRDDRVGCDPEVETCDPDPPPDRDCPPNCPPPDRDCPPNCPPPNRDCPPDCPPPNRDCPPDCPPPNRD
ncbi:MAG TPA: sigma factor-like helix-turn-helix DNA-binding protein, partial [Thermoleophilaceae bacterium]